MIRKTVIILGLLVYPTLMKAQTIQLQDSVASKLQQLDRMKGTWLLTYADTAKSGFVHQDTILTTFKWSAKRDSLLGKQEIRDAGGISHVYIVYSYDQKSGQYFYIESTDPKSYPAAAPLIVNGETWIYPNGESRVLNVFSHSGRMVTYYVQVRQSEKWLTTKSGTETKIID